MIRALLKNGKIVPAEPLPRDWAEGQELLVDRSVPSDNPRAIDEWAHELEEEATSISAEEAEEFRRTLEDVERQSKESVRREWGLL